MRNHHLILLQVLFSVFLISSIASAAPNINDGFMSYTSSSDWGGLGAGTVTTFSGNFSPFTALTNVSVEEGDTYGEDYDVEEIGLYIKDHMLYIGLQTNYDLKQATGVLPGDFIFNLDESSDAFWSDNRDEDDFAFDFSIDSNGNVDLTLLAGNLVGGSDTTYTSNYGKDWEITEWDYAQTFSNAGIHTVGNNGGDNNYGNGSNTLEAAINLNELSGDLNTLFQGFAASSSSVTMYWQPSCGNDFLAARSDFNYTTDNPVPEPATMLLFGMGLLGAGAVLRKNNKNVEKKG